MDEKKSRVALILLTSMVTNQLKWFFGFSITNTWFCSWLLKEGENARSRGCCRSQSRDSPAACGKSTLGRPILKDCIPWRGPMPVQFLKDCIPGKGSQAEAGEKWEEKGAAETSCYGLTSDLIVHCLEIFRKEEKVEELKWINKSYPGKNGGEEESAVLILSLILTIQFYMNWQ